jgi:hypothetical protein
MPMVVRALRFHIRPRQGQVGSCTTFDLMMNLATWTLAAGRLTYRVLREHRRPETSPSGTIQESPVLGSGNRPRVGGAVVTSGFVLACSMFAKFADDLRYSHYETSKQTWSRDHGSVGLPPRAHLTTRKNNDGKGGQESGDSAL